MQPIAAYTRDNGYRDIDRSAAQALNLPLTAQLAAIEPSDRGLWLVALVTGLADGLSEGCSMDVEGEAYKIGQRVALLLVEEGGV
ncbi:hypothetical protein OIE52_39230 [Streptomyces canus]|uniref:hypothetical protein n=1 Tax=Streptomyces canus TaxID=58343 RepID=UPI0032518F83